MCVRAVTICVQVHALRAHRHVCAHAHNCVGVHARVCARVQLCARVWTFLRVCMCLLIFLFSFLNACVCPRVLCARVRACARTDGFARACKCFAGFSHARTSVLTGASARLALPGARIRAFSTVHACVCFHLGLDVYVPVHAWRTHMHLRPHTHVCVRVQEVGVCAWAFLRVRVRVFCPSCSWYTNVCACVYACAFAPVSREDKRTPVHLQTHVAAEDAKAYVRMCWRACYTARARARSAWPWLCQCMFLHAHTCVEPCICVGEVFQRVYVRVFACLACAQTHVCALAGTYVGPPTRIGRVERMKTSVCCVHAIASTYTPVCACKHWRVRTDIPVIPARDYVREHICVRACAHTHTCLRACIQTRARRRKHVQDYTILCLRFSNIPHKHAREYTHMCLRVALVRARDLASHTNISCCAHMCLHPCNE